MKRGQIVFPDGSSGSCGYEFTNETSGILRFPDLVFTAHGDSVAGASLELADGSRRSIDLTLGPRVGEARFRIAN